MKLLLALSFAAATAASFAAPQETAAQKNARMEWWKEARFGLFLHWGLYAVPAGEWNGKTGYGEWILEEAHIPVSQYEKFKDKFNPVKFDAEKWVTMAQNAGMKYIVITSKHHEGFNMFASKHTDYNIMNTPFHRDPMKELAAACKRHGLKMCFYHSIMDWHHPDYLPRRGWETRPAAGADFRRFVQYLRNDVTQLLTEYGPIGVMWFDGEWESTWNHQDGQALYDLCRKLQPNVIVNNRVDVGRSGMAGMSTSDGTAGDYGTPEQEIPAEGIPGSFWETCMTMNDHWGYNKNDFDYKSGPDLIHKLVDIASKGGNFLLNIGPTAEGEFPPLAQNRLKALGDWTRVYGDAIYKTEASPFSSLPWGRCTQGVAGGHKVLYLSVFDWPKDGKLVVPGIGNKPIRAYPLNNRSQSLRVTRNEGDLIIDVPSSAPNAVCSVVALQIQGEPIVYKAPMIQASSTILIQPLMVSLATPGSSLQVRYTLDGSDPTITSPLYTGPFSVANSVTVKTRSFDAGKPVSSVTEQRFEKVTPWPASPPFGSSPGLMLRVYTGDWDVLPKFNDLKPQAEGTMESIGLQKWGNREHFGFRADGYLQVPADGVYTFDLSSDDGSRLTIDGKVVVNNDGLHGMGGKAGVAPLAEGLHAITVEYFNKTGGLGLSLQWGLIGQPLTAIPPSLLVQPNRVNVK